MGLVRSYRKGRQSVKLRRVSIVGYFEGICRNAKKVKANQIRVVSQFELGRKQVFRQPEAFWDIPLSCCTESMTKALNGQAQAPRLRRRLSLMLDCGNNVHQSSHGHLLMLTHSERSLIKIPNAVLYRTLPVIAWLSS